MVTSGGLHGPQYPRCGRGFLSSILIAIILLSSVLGVTAVSDSAKAEIPHENYDIANPDLGTVVNLLNTSIRASEEALKEFYNETMADADEHLAMVDSILVPAQQILSRIEYVASSYENLSELLPPFLDLRTEMESFSSMEKRLMDSRTSLLSLRNFTNLTDEELISAMQIVRTFNSLVANMNSTIDEMLVSAAEVTDMTLEGRTPFQPNALRPLIEKLRDLLGRILEEMTPVIHNDIPWGPDRPDRSFLLLWVEATNVYLGDKVVGGGYLFYNGSFRGNQPVHVLWDGTEVVGTTTDQNGAYGFTLRLDLNESLLGQHMMMATAQTPYTNLSSDEITITVLLVPTYLRLDVNTLEMSVNETVSVVLDLTDVHGRTISNATCELDYAEQVSSALTDTDGRISRAFTGSQLGFGSHSFSASYIAELPYRPSSDGPVIVTVSIPTHFELELFSEKFVPGYYIVGAGKLLANSSQPLPSQKVAIYIDEQFILNATTDTLGEFALSIPSTDLSGGTHTLRVAFDSHGVVWRYSDTEVPFLITTMHKGKYPFFPFFPGWQTMPPSQIVYLFFGPYAYYVWLFMLVVLAIIVKTVRARKARASARKELVEETLIAEPSTAEIATPTASAVQLPDWTASPESPLDPNSRIVWLYNMLIEFLRRKRKITITDDMTHWEVARLLRKLGYPKDSVERVTLLFEKAFYSGAKMSDVDSVGMSVAMDGLRSGGVKNAG